MKKVFIGLMIALGIFIFFTILVMGLDVWMVKILIPFGHWIES